MQADVETHRKISALRVGDQTFGDVVAASIEVYETNASDSKVRTTIYLDKDVVEYSNLFGSIFVFEK